MSAESKLKKAEILLGTKEVAAKLKITPKELRAYLRKINGKAPGVRYEWNEKDAFLVKLPKLIKQQEEKEQAKKVVSK